MRDLFKIRDLLSNDAMAAKTSHKKRIYFLPVLIGIIPTHLLLSKVGEPPWSWIARIPIQVEKEK